VNIKVDSVGLRDSNTYTFYNKVLANGTCCPKMQEQFGESIFFSRWDGKWVVNIHECKFYEEDGLFEYPHPISFCPFCGERIAVEVNE